MHLYALPTCASTVRTDEQPVARVAVPLLQACSLGRAAPLPLPLPPRRFIRNVGSLSVYAFVGTTISCFTIGLMM